MTRLQLAKELYNWPSPKNLGKVSRFVAVETSGFPMTVVDPSRPHISVVELAPGTPLSISGRNHGWGETDNF